MSAEFLFRDWDVAFREFRAARDRLFQFFAAGAAGARSSRGPGGPGDRGGPGVQRRVSYHGGVALAAGGRLPLGRDNFVGVGYGFKNIPGDDRRDPWQAVLARTFEQITGGRVLYAKAYRYLMRVWFEKVKPSPCVKFYVKEKATRDELVDPRFLLRNVKRELGIQHVETEVVETGTVAPAARLVRLPCGGGHSNLKGGTLGAIVKGRTGSDRVLSCAHVVVDFQRPRETLVVQPRRIDGGSQDFGHWLDFKINLGDFGEVDAAVVEPLASVEVLGRVYGSTRAPTVLEPVTKVGATTGRTVGVVTEGGNQIAGVAYTSDPIEFREAFVVSPRLSLRRDQDIRPFAREGDSGSIVESFSGEALGMVMATRREFAIACKGPSIERELGIRF